MQGKSAAQKICCKRRIHAPKKPTAVRRDLVFTGSPSLAMMEKESKLLLFCNQSGIDKLRGKVPVVNMLRLRRANAPEIVHRDVRYSGVAEH
jgi:hypothetical protein